MKNLVYILAVITVIALSCKKSKEKKLIGEWEVIPLFTEAGISTTVWTFKDNGTLIITDYDSSSVTLQEDTALYELKESFFKYYVTLTDYSKYWDGDYHIEDLNNEQLILQCQDPYIRKEFIKK